MSISFKVILNKRKANKQNLYPLTLRVYQGGSSKEHNLNIKLSEADWDVDKQQLFNKAPDSSIYNGIIDNIKRDVKRIVLLAELDRAVLTPEDVLSKVFPSGDIVVPAIKPPTSIIKFGLDLVKQLNSSGRVGNALAYSCAVNKLRAFVGTDSFSFEQLTYKRLNEFKDSMSTEGIKVNSISVYMRTLRALYNRAIKEDLVKQEYYPFKSFRIKNEKTMNRVLTIAELKLIFSLELEPNSPIWHWRNYFILSFCLIGVNFSDLLTLKGENLVDGRVIFRRKKTHKVYSLKLHPKALEVFGFYSMLNGIPKTEFLLPVIKQDTDQIKLKKEIWQAIKTCNEYLGRMVLLCGIKKDVTTYYARYTWANIARGLGYSKDIIGQALGHSYGNSTTSIYLDDYDNSIIDEANSRVIEKVSTQRSYKSLYSDQKINLVRYSIVY